MSETVELKAFPRDVVGKANRRLASQGLLPAVVYGANTTATPLSIPRHDAELLMSGEGAGASIIRLNIEGGKPIDTVVKTVQHEPMKGRLQHIDFLAVSADHEVSTQVPIHFVGDSAGVRSGGVLMHNLQVLHIQALPKDLPDALELDVSGLEVGDSVTVADLPLSKGVTALDDGSVIVCSVTPPTVAPTAEESATEQAPEVIGAEEES